MMTVESLFEFSYGFECAPFCILVSGIDFFTPNACHARQSTKSFEVHVDDSYAVNKNLSRYYSWYVQVLVPYNLYDARRLLFYLLKSKIVV